jgi:hypothetical protein
MSQGGWAGHNYNGTKWYGRTVSPTFPGTQWTVLGWTNSWSTLGYIVTRTKHFWDPVSMDQNKRVELSIGLKAGGLNVKAPSLYSVVSRCCWVDCREWNCANSQNTENGIIFLTYLYIMLSLRTEKETLSTYLQNTTKEMCESYFGNNFIYNIHIIYHLTWAKKIFFFFVFFWRTSVHFHNFSPLLPLTEVSPQKCHPRWQPTRRLAVSCGLGRRIS